VGEGGRESRSWRWRMRDRRRLHLSGADPVVGGFPRGRGGRQKLTDDDEGGKRPGVGGQVQNPWPPGSTWTSGCTQNTYLYNLILYNLFNTIITGPMPQERYNEHVIFYLHSNPVLMVSTNVYELRSSRLQMYLATRWYSKLIFTYLAMSIRFF
jgi:hypothetical protein